jgi:hypothetical protein
MTINPPKSHGKGAGLLHVTSISEMLVHFGKENDTKLDGSTAFTKLGDELIPKGGVMLRFSFRLRQLTWSADMVAHVPLPMSRCLLDARDAAASLGK